MPVFLPGRLMHTRSDAQLLARNRTLALINEIMTEKGLMLNAGSAVDATLIAAPSSTRNGSGTRDPEMQSTQKGGNWYFGMKMHIGVSADSGLLHTVIGTAANVQDINVAQPLLHGKETDVYADTGYQGIEKRREADAVPLACCNAAGKAQETGPG
jgi:transposase, IS5 family